MMAFALAGALAGVIAAVTVPLTSASWSAGLEVTLVAFIAAALAGFTSPGRAVLFGLALGVLQSLAAGKISSEYRMAIVYGTLIVFLLGRDLIGRDGVLQRMSKLSRVKAETDESGRRPPATDPRAHGGLRRAHGGRRAAAARDLRRHRPAFAAADRICSSSPSSSPSFSSDVGFQSAATYVVLGAVGATGLGLILGLAGQLSLGHAVFFIIGGYGVAILTVKSGWGLLPAALVAVAASIVVAYLIGRLTVRLSGFNLALATLAIQLIAIVVAAQRYPQGITGLPIMHLFGTEFIDAKQFFYLGMGDPLHLPLDRPQHLGVADGPCLARGGTGRGGGREPRPRRLEDEGPDPHARRHDGRAGRGPLGDLRQPRHPTRAGTSPSRSPCSPT